MGCEGCESEKPVTQVHQGQSLDDILSDLEAVLTRIDSSDEEALV